jgi:hypothetical protein
LVEEKKKKSLSLFCFHSLHPLLLSTHLLALGTRGFLRLHARHNMTDLPPISTPKHSILGRLPGALPKSSIPENIDADEIVESFVEHLTALELDHIADDVIWRDVFALTGTLRTFYSKSTVLNVWKELFHAREGHDIVFVPGSGRAIQSGPSGWVDGMFKFKTKSLPPTNCSGIVSLVLGDDGRWRAWVMRSILDSLEGQGDVDKLEPPTTKLCNGIADSKTFDAVIVGGGQAGLSLGGRLQSLHISYVVLDENEHVGDSWRLRYDSARRALFVETMTSLPLSLTI